MLKLLSIKRVVENGDNDSSSSSNSIISSNYWTCPKGSYCLSPAHIDECPMGYYCPKNTFSFNLCFEGYYCPNPSQLIKCSKNEYCPKGSIKPINMDINWSHVLITIFLTLSLILRFINLKVFKPKTLLTETIEKVPNKTEENNGNDSEYLEIGELIGYNGVSGKLKLNSSLAILGPSGVGKTTLINKLINCEGLKAKLGHNCKIALVPQFDCLIENLTVWDTLHHEVMLKQPIKMNNRDKLNQLEDTIKNLNLTHVLNNKIGNFENRGLSGGERKRVSIGMELVGSPDLLLLDEPTTGLDSSSSDKICKWLGNMAKEGKLTTISTIHAPSFKSYSTFDTIALMGKGGHFLYLGPKSSILNYFQVLGFLKPKEFSTSEFLVEIASNSLFSSIEGLGIERLFSIWQTYYNHVDLVSRLKTSDFNKNFEGELGELDMIIVEELATSPKVINFNWMWQIQKPSKVGVLEFFKGKITSIGGIIDELIEFGPIGFKEFVIGGKRFQSFIFNRVQGIELNFEKFIFQFKLCFKRAYLENFELKNNAIESLIFIFMGIMMGIMSRDKTFTGPLPAQLCNLLPLPLVPRCRLPIENKINNLGSFISYAIAFLASSNNLRTFGENQKNFMREFKVGLQPLAFFSAKFSLDLIRLIVNSILFTLTLLNFYTTVSSNIPYLFGIICSSYLFGMASSYLFSLIISPKLSKLVIIFNNIIWYMMFNGLLPTLTKVNNEYPYIIRSLWKLSVPRWIISSFYLLETQYRMHLDPSSANKIELGYEFDTIEGGLINSILIGLGWLFLTWLIMYFKSK